MDNPITDFDQVSSEWLTGRLRARGHLGQEEALLREVLVEPGLEDRVARFEVTYSAETDLPTRFILKKGTGKACVDREVGFWEATVSLGGKPPTAPCFDALRDVTTKDAHLLSEDVSTTHYTRREGAPTGLREDLEQAIDCLAKIHAFWWDHPDLGKSLGSFPAEDNILFFGRREDFERQLIHAVDVGGDWFLSERRTTLERALRSYPYKDLKGRSRLLPGNHLTAINGYLDYDRVFFPVSRGAQPTYLIDWGLWEVRVGTDDIAQWAICDFAIQNMDCQSI